MPYNISSLVYGPNNDPWAFGTHEVRQHALEATGFAKLCYHGHWMHTPNNAPLPAHNGDYHNPDRNGIGGHYPDPNGTSGQGDLRFDQYHENDLTGRGYDADEIIRHLVSTGGNVSMCPHGAVVENGNGSCYTGAHTAPFMRGVERNMPSLATDDALVAPDGEWRQHHTWNSSNSFPDEEDDYSGYGKTPRNEQRLIDEEPERAEQIRQNISKVVALANSPRVKNSGYTARVFPAGTFYEHGIDDKSPDQAERHGADWTSHTVIGYHNGVAVGKLNYSSQGYVGGWYIDHQHHKGPANIQMLAAAHNHLLQLGNPLGMLHSENTTSNSAAVIRKIDPNSTWLKQPSANTGWEEGNVWDPKYHDEGVFPLLPEHTERRSRREWAHLSDFTGLNIHELHAISPDKMVRRNANMDYVKDNEAADINHAYETEHRRQIRQIEVKSRIETRDSIPQRIAKFSVPAGYLGDTANLETQFPEHTHDTIGSSYPHVMPWRGTVNSAGLDIPGDGFLGEFTNDTRQKIVATRNKNSDRAFRLKQDADIRSGANPAEKLMERVSADASGVWTGEEDTPVQKSPEERARALMATPRYRREF